MMYNKINTPFFSNMIAVTLIYFLSINQLLTKNYIIAIINLYYFIVASKNLGKNRIWLIFSLLKLLFYEVLNLAI